MINRIMNYEKNDWKHIWFCIKVMFSGFYKGNTETMREGWQFLTLHLMYDSQKINLEDK